jgi:hypothetical protein
VSVRATLFPHEFIAITDNVPPDAEVVTVMELPVDDPVQPDGSVHTYPVAPLTGVIEYVSD